MKPTIDEFLEGKGRAFGEALDHPDFDYCYCRFYNGEFTFANIHVHRPGTGSFTRCLEYLSDKEVVKIITVESAGSGRFAKKLEKLGFVQKPNSPTTYWRVNNGHLQQPES